ncbi:hypothetical protein C8J27_1172 [Rhodobacter aestuarii]|uniref:Uncharacterized protein n=1 Tax=Rhodobacter aestuarii TaxID=453582 RepID=A0A1N7QGW6_9RHOB|nr:hypothetical protein [Rhodobacter aestuarii]PTV93387.1 hypothetical protein C8J27_1172 [Rhodobacter aestuarii]SIT22151.1 hypothetical protein SAMN05421580_11925 [Rhodobacter aestuarii]
MRRFHRGVVPLLALLGMAPGALAQQAAPKPPEPFVPVAVPADWVAARFEGLDLRRPPEFTPMDEDRDSRTWGKLDEVAKRGFILRLEFDDSPERRIKRDGGVERGAVVMPDGHVFRRWQMIAPPDAGVKGEVELLVSDLPIRGDEKLSIDLMAVNADIAEMRPVFASFVSGLILPPPGTPLRRDIFGGIVQLPLDGGWSGLRSSDSDDLRLHADDLEGQIEIARGAAQTGPMPIATPGQPVRFMGQNAQIFAFEDGAQTRDDGTGQSGQGRVVVLETCLPDGAAISFVFGGMPGFYHDARLTAPFAGGRIALPEGARPCAPGVLPAGASPAISSAAARPEVLPPFDVPAPGAGVPRAEGQALGGLFDYRLPPGWEVTRPDTGSRIEFAGAGVRVVLARAAALRAPGGPAALLPTSSFARSDMILGWPTRRHHIADGAHAIRVYLYDHCLGGGEEPFGLAFIGPGAFFESDAFGTLTRGLRLNMPDDIRPCPEAALAPGGAAAEAEATAQQPPAQTGPVTQQTATVAGGAGGVGGGAQTPADAPPPPASPPQQGDDPDLFLPGPAGYALYRNGRYGTHISFPASYFQPDAPPDSGDGRSFTSIDGWARFYVFAQYNAEGLDARSRMARDIEAHGSASYQASGPGWYVISGVIGTDTYYRRATETLSGLIQVFEISYPAARKSEFDPVASYMAASFGSGSD